MNTLHKDILHKVLADIGRCVEKTGFMLATQPEINISGVPLETIAMHFGDLQCHKLAEPNGITELKGSASPGHDDPTMPLVEQKLLHTDSAYLNGLVSVVDGYRVLGPPSLLLLECKQQAAEGGDSLLIDGQAILKDMLRDDPQTAKIWLSPCVSLVRNEAVIKNSLFEAMPDGHYRVRYRYDALPHPGAEQALRRFEECLLDERYTYRYRMQTGNILFADNYRMLHGREPFACSGSSPRHLRRALIFDARSEFIPCAKNIGTFPDRFAVYGILPSNVNLPISVRVGIELSDEEKAIVASLR